MFLVGPTPVETAVQLDQHSLPRHALAAHPVLGRTPSPQTAQTGVDQDAPQGGPADVDAVALAQPEQTWIDDPWEVKVSCLHRFETAPGA